MQFLTGIFLDPAVAAARQLLNDPDCLSLFDVNEMDFLFGDVNPANILQNAYGAGQIRLFPFGDNVPSGVMAQTTGPDGLIQIASNRAFVTGILADGSSITQAQGFGGLSAAEADVLMLLHELLHFTGSAGADNAGQAVTLANNDIVIGSAGVTAEVRQHCLHQ